MADSRGTIFLAAVLGNSAPLVLRFAGQVRTEEGMITLPGGGTMIGFVSWCGAAVVVAAFCGVIAVLFKERDTKKAFVLGLMLPYTVSGMLADGSAALKPRAARAQLQPDDPTAGVTKAKLDFPFFVALTVETRAADTNESLQATTQIYRPGDNEPVAVSKFGVYVLPKGNYRIAASAPGYETAALDIKHVAPQSVTLKLKRSSTLEQFIDGAKSYVWPPAPTGAPPAAPKDLIIR